MGDAVDESMGSPVFGNFRISCRGCRDEDMWDGGNVSVLFSSF